MKAITYFLLDVFTDIKFGGNQLAVVPDADGLTTEQMLLIAKEFNLSETTFIVKPQNPANDFGVRIFTTHKELATAGHPTIGTAFLILNTLHYTPKQKNILMLEELVGDIKVTYKETDHGFDEITMEQPLPVFSAIFTKIDLIAKILSIEVAEIENHTPVQVISCGNKFLYIPVKHLHSIQKIKINVPLWEAHADEIGALGIYAFTQETVNAESTTHGRMFAPLEGIYEDAATGSASGPLGCYLVAHSLSVGTDIICEQGYEIGRPSTINVQSNHNEGIINQVLVGGNSILIGKGELYI